MLVLSHLLLLLLWTVAVHLGIRTTENSWPSLTSVPAIHPQTKNLWPLAQVLIFRCDVERYPLLGYTIRGELTVHLHFSINFLS